MYKLTDYLQAVEDLTKMNKRIKTLTAQRDTVERALEILENAKVSAQITEPLVNELTNLNAKSFDLQILAHSKAIDLLVHEKRMNDAE